MLIDTTAPLPPVEFWVVTRARVLAGKLPIRVTKDTRWRRLANGTPVLVETFDKGPSYSVNDCHTNVHTALDAAGRIARAEILAEQSRHTAKLAKLQHVQRLARGYATDAQLLAALGPCGK